jgi:hypothetical protein
MLTSPTKTIRKSKFLTDLVNSKKLKSLDMFFLMIENGLHFSVFQLQTKEKPSMGTFNFTSLKVKNNR